MLKTFLETKFADLNVIHNSTLGMLRSREVFTFGDLFDLYSRGEMLDTTEGETRVSGYDGQAGSYVADYLRSHPKDVMYLFQALKLRSAEPKHNSMALLIGEPRDMATNLAWLAVGVALIGSIYFLLSVV